MPTHAEKRHLPYTQMELYELVARVDRYPEFLPWCTAARITERDNGTFFADLVVQFKVFRERLRSKVTLHPHHLVDVEYITCPFRYLNNHLRFIEADDGESMEQAVYLAFEAWSKSGGSDALVDSPMDWELLPDGDPPYHVYPLRYRWSRTFRRWIPDDPLDRWGV